MYAKNCYGRTNSRLTGKGIGYGGRNAGRRRDKKRRKEKKGYKMIMWLLTAICIVIVCAAMAMQMKASQVVAAENMARTQQVAAAQSAVYEAQERAVSEEQARQEEQARLEREKAEAEAARVIVIDPGHGGVDGGCAFDNVTEKEINLQIAQAVVRKLKERGYNVSLSRDGDTYVDKKERIVTANKQNARLYVSIHQNSCEVKSVEGIETWYDKNDRTGESRKLAQFVQQGSVDASGAVCRELVADTELCVLNRSRMPACLIETGFLSNQEEREKLCTGEYQEQIAEGIANGIGAYLESAAIF